jgi:hypothetical protein
MNEFYLAQSAVQRGATTRESVKLRVNGRTAAGSDGPKVKKQAHKATSSHEAQLLMLSSNYGKRELQQRVTVDRDE